MKNSSDTNHPAREHFPLNVALWFEPAMFGTLLLGSFLLTPPPTMLTGTWVLRIEIGRYLTPVLNQALPILGVASTIVVAIAVWTRFGLDASLVPPKLRRVLGTVVGAMTLLIGMISLCAVYVAISDSRRWPEVGAVIGLSWMLCLMCRFALGVVGYRAQAKAARRRWHRSRERAERYDLTRLSVLPTTSKSNLLSSLLRRS